MVPPPAAITGVPIGTREVDALVHARVAEHRMEAHAETGRMRAPSTGVFISIPLALWPCASK